MERKHLYKAASETVDKLRTRKREEQCGLRKEKREKILSLKRFRYEERGESSEALKFSVEDVISLVKTIRKHGPDSLTILRKLKRAFTQENVIADTFIAQDGALQSLVRYLTGIYICLDALKIRSLAG